MASRAAGIHDTTLRDGEQMAGVAFAPEQKLSIAEKIVEFGAGLIDIMPVVSQSEFLVTKELCSMYADKVSATCRAKKEDIDRAVSAGASRVTIFSPLSDLHVERKLGITREENIERSVGMVDYAADRGLCVDFAGEDATRADFSYFCEFLRAVQGKIRVFFVADTVGCLTPKSSGNLMRYLKKNFSCMIGIHAHNDFGMATANTVEAALAGADFLSGTFTGIGERAGNAPIEEVCTSLLYLHGMDMGVRLHMLKEICDAVQEISGVCLQKHKPVVGENAFAHESGIHVDGILKDPRTYEAFDPGSVGQKRRICLGKHSGRSGAEHFLYEKMSCRLPSEKDIEKLLSVVKKIHERRLGREAGMGTAAPEEADEVAGVPA